MSSSERLPRWYFGGLASSAAVVFTHPLDLVKVLLQTSSKEKVHVFPMIANLYKTHGILGFYNGLSASLLRQMSYSTLRFAVYDTLKISLGPDINLSSRMLIAFAAGAVGGYIGTPPDKVNVRMQNDVKLPPEKRFNYKHAVDGLVQVYKQEGFQKLFAGGEVTAFRAGIMAIGQLAFYDQAKKTLIESSYFADNVATHITSSIIAAWISTALTQPLDVVKTRYMNSKPGEFKNVTNVISFTTKEGPVGFFKGFVPAFLRLGPQTVLIFVFYEQLRMHFGYFSEEKNV